MNSLLYILLFLLWSECTFAYVYYNLSHSVVKSVDVGEPLFLTNFIETGKIAHGREKARVQHPALTEVESYAGYITINKDYNSNTFFWFFPSQSNRKYDPVILWFIGGPGLTDLVSIFAHNGPITFESKDILISRNHTLVSNHSMIYIDNPIGSGFSFTDNEKGYARNQSDVANHTITFLVQFFKLFPEYRERDFYVGGDSYGGKFVLSVADGLRKHNYRNEFYINLRGIIMGNGLVDQKPQGYHGDFLYAIGLVDMKGREAINNVENKWGMNYELLFHLTGFSYFSNLLVSTNTYGGNIKNWAKTYDFRKAVNVGNKDFNASSDVVRYYFEQTWENSETALLEELLCQNYRVLVYNGQLDIVFPYTSSQNFYEQLKWPGVQDYINADRQQWWVDGELAGYVKVAGNFYEALVRNAGHVTFTEQPKWSWELITRYTHNKPIAQGKPIDEIIKAPQYTYLYL